MKLAGRLAAAMDVLSRIDARHRPASEALKDWGTSNRFAGSGDRAAIGNLVYDVLRKRASHAYGMGSDDPRGLVLSVAVRDWGEDPAALNASFEGDRFAPPAITEDEIARLTSPEPLAGAPDWVRADVPEWTASSLIAGWGDDWVTAGQGMTGRPPLDLRVNTLRSTRERVEKSLARFNPQRTDYAPDGLRLPAGPRDARTPNVIVDEGYQKGWFEVQDQGSQLAAILAGAKPGEQVLDLCAGAGGKTLAMAAAMDNKGQIFAYDSDRSRLAPIHERLKRNGVRNAQVRSPDPGVLDDLAGKMDRVVIDAPCTGSGTWRRRPDAKWKLTPAQLAARVAEQQALLSEAVRFVKPGGHLAYITCSIFAEENEQQLQGFLAEHADFTADPGASLWAAHFGEKSGPLFPAASGVALAPHITETDGFYVVVCTRRT
jgi:16S rRNA (cytosine967-C5)-methyltransferase